VRSGSMMDTKESLRPLPAPPQTSNDTKNNDIIHTSTSPAQLALILSKVLADNEILSKDLAVARARYERAEQTLALLNPPHTSVIVASNSPPSAYPELAVRTIMDLQSHLEAEKAAREAAESRLRTISEAWLDLDRYFQTSEVHLSDARSHFSQLLRDPFAKPSFNPIPAYQPHPSSQSASRSPVAASQTFPTFPQPSAAASLPDRVRHHDGSTEDVPPPKRIRTDQGPLDSIFVRICHTYHVLRIHPSVVVLAYTRPRTAFIQYGRNESSLSFRLPRATTFLTRPPPRTPRSVPMPLGFSNMQPKLVHISR
jgi:hypothetical protein